MGQKSVILERIKEKRIWFILGMAVMVFLAFWLVTLKTEIYPLLKSNGILLGCYCAVTLAVFAFSVGLIVYFVKKKKICLDRIFLICILATGSIYLFILPPMTAPDEIAHYATAYKWSNYMMFKEPVDENGYVYMRAEDADAPITHLNTKDNYEQFLGSLFRPCQNTETTTFSYMQVPAGPIPYLPQAIGITIGRLFHLSWAMTMVLGRLMNLLFFAVCIFWAIRIIPFGKKVLFILSMLPMTLELVSSMSYDVVPLALSFLFIAVCFDDIFKKEQIGIKEIVVLGGLLALLAPCKAVYFLLAGLCLMIPRQKFLSRKFYWGSAIFVFCITIMPMVLANITTLSGLTESGDNIISWAGAPGFTIGMLLSKPIYFIYLLLNTIRTLFEYYWSTMIGARLSWLNIPIGYFYVISFTILLLLASLKQEQESTYITAGHKVWCMVLFVAVSFLIVFSMLLGHTPITSIYAEGVQGRYFLPIMPLFLLCVRNNCVVLKKNIDKGIIIAAVVLNVFVVQKIVAVSLNIF